MDRAKRIAGLVLLFGFGLLAVAPADAQPLGTVDRHGSLVAVEAYAPNIVHVTLALDPALAEAPPGYGISAAPDPAGWTHRTDASGDIFASSALSLTVVAQPWPKPPSQMERYFAPSLPPVSLVLRTGDGRELVRMDGWEMAPHTVNGEKTFRVGASFSDTPDEHYYGLGQNQEGILDLRGRTIDCRHNYDAPAGETVCVPVLVTNKGYAIVWDNPSATTVSAGLNNATHFQSERRRARLLLHHRRRDCRRTLCGLSQADRRHAAAAQGRLRPHPEQGALREPAGADGHRRGLSPAAAIRSTSWCSTGSTGRGWVSSTSTAPPFPIPGGMNDQLHRLGHAQRSSASGRGSSGRSRYYDMLAAKGWFLQDKDGNVVDGLPIRSDRAGALIDSTNPDARAWYWGKIRDNILSQGFDWFVAR